jgi:hypothetical protein
MEQVEFDVVQLSTAFGRRRLDFKNREAYAPNSGRNDTRQNRFPQDLPTNLHLDSVLFYLEDARCTGTSARIRVEF